MFHSIPVVAALLLVADIASAKKIKITTTNIAYQQPMGPFFVAVHNATAEPVFRLGTVATSQLGTLAEFGNPQPLVDYYTMDATMGIASAKAEGAGVFFAGETRSFEVQLTKMHPYVSFASMAVNTNDCFVGIDTMKFFRGATALSPGYDSGTEENNESCDSVPGPACNGTGTAISGNGEGVVHIHRGIHGIADLDASVYDWRNPMLKIEAMDCADLDLTVKLWDAKKDTVIRPLMMDDKICVYDDSEELSIEVIPGCSANVIQFRLFKDKELVLSKNDRMAPYTLGGYKGKKMDVLPVPELSMPGTYYLKVGEPRKLKLYKFVVKKC